MHNTPPDDTPARNPVGTEMSDAQFQTRLTARLTSLETITIDEQNASQREFIRRSAASVLREAAERSPLLLGALTLRLCQTIGTHFAPCTALATALLGTLRALPPDLRRQGWIEVLDKVMGSGLALPPWVVTLLHDAATENHLPGAPAFEQTLCQRLAPSRAALDHGAFMHTLRQLEDRPCADTLARLVGHMALLVLKPEPNQPLDCADLGERRPRLPHTTAWPSTRNPNLVFRGTRALRCHWLLTPWGASALRRLLAVCERLPVHAFRVELRRHLLQVVGTCAGIARRKVGSERPVFMLCVLNAVCTAIDNAGEAWAWPEVARLLDETAADQPPPRHPWEPVFHALLVEDLSGDAEHNSFVIRTLLTEQVPLPHWLGLLTSWARAARGRTTQLSVSLQRALAEPWLHTLTLNALLDPVDPDSLHPLAMEYADGFFACQPMHGPVMFPAFDALDHTQRCCPAGLVPLSGLLRVLNRIGLHGSQALEPRHVRAIATCLLRHLPALPARAQASWINHLVTLALQTLEQLQGDEPVLTEAILRAQQQALGPVNTPG